MSDPRFIQPSKEKELAHLVEECGEVLHAAGKIQRFGFEAVNPLLPKSEQEQNVAWLYRELGDLEGAIVRLKVSLISEGLVEP